MLRFSALPSPPMLTSASFSNIARLCLSTQAALEVPAGGHLLGSGPAGLQTVWWLFDGSRLCGKKTSNKPTEKVSFFLFSPPSLKSKERAGPTEIMRTRFSRKITHVSERPGFLSKAGKLWPLGDRRSWGPGLEVSWGYQTWQRLWWSSGQKSKSWHSAATSPPSSQDIPPTCSSACRALCGFPGNLRGRHDWSASSVLMEFFCQATVSVVAN